MLIETKIIQNIELIFRVWIAMLALMVILKRTELIPLIQTQIFAKNVRTNLSAPA